MMRGKKGNVEKDVKINHSDFDLEETAALSWKLKNQARNYLPSYQSWGWAAETLHHGGWFALNKQEAAPAGEGTSWWRAELQENWL